MSQQLDANLSKVDQYLNRFKGQTLGHYIGSGWQVPAGETFENTSPVDNSVLNTVAAGSASDIASAADAAAAAFSDWKRTSGAIPRKLLHKMADLIEARRVDVAQRRDVDVFLHRGDAL